MHAELVGSVEEAGWPSIELAYLSIIKIVQKERHILSVPVSNPEDCRSGLDRPGNTL